MDTQSFFLSLGLSIHGLWCKNSCEILFKPYISIQNLKEHYMSHPRIMPFSNSNSEFRSWWPERLQSRLREPKNWQLRSPNRKTWTKKPTNLLLHFKHEIQVIHEGLVPNPPWNCEFIPENGCFKNTILSFSNGLFSGVNLLVVSGRVSIFSKATKKILNKVHLSIQISTSTPSSAMEDPRDSTSLSRNWEVSVVPWPKQPPQRDDGDGSRGWDKENLH